MLLHHLWILAELLQFFVLCMTQEPLFRCGFFMGVCAVLTNAEGLSCAAELVTAAVLDDSVTLIRSASFTSSVCVSGIDFSRPTISFSPTISTALASTMLSCGYCVRIHSITCLDEYSFVAILALTSISDWPLAGAAELVPCDSNLGCLMALPFGVTLGFR